MQVKNGLQTASLQTCCWTLACHRFMKAVSKVLRNAGSVLLSFPGQTHMMSDQLRGGEGPLHWQAGASLSLLLRFEFEHSCSAE